MVDFNLKPLRQRVYNGCTYAVQTAGYLVSPAAELTAGMKDRKYDFNCRQSCFFLDIDRDSTSVINDRDRIIRVDLHINGVAVSCQGLIHCVIHDLIYQMVKSPRRRTSNVHSRSFSYSLKSLQNLDLICIIFCAHEVPPLVFALYRSFNNLKNLVHPEFAVYKLIQPCTGDQGLDVGNF